MINKFFSEIVEQEKAKTILEKIYQSRRVPHAFLFYGKEGVGKFNTAVQFAKLLNSGVNLLNLNSALDDKISSLREPYIKLILPLPRGKGEGGDDSPFDKLPKEVIETISQEIKTKSINPYHKISIEDANTIKISSIRDVKKFVSVRLDDVDYRIIIISDAHLMNDQAQNSLLKNLEEPPEGIIFILITSDKEKLLHTIQSRCWNINFEPLSESGVSFVLKKYFQIEGSVASKVAHFADGSVTDALTLAHTNFDSTLEKTISVLRYSLAKRYSSAYKELSGFLGENSEELISVLIKMIKTWIRDVVKNKSNIGNYYFDNYSETLYKFNSRFGQADITKLFSVLDRLDEYYSNKVNLNVLYLNIIFEISTVSIGNASVQK